MDSRLIDQPSQGGEDDAVLKSSMIEFKFPTGPVSRKKERSFLEKLNGYMRKLNNGLEDEAIEETRAKTSFCNFRKLSSTSKGFEDLFTVVTWHQEPC